jgi:hypothetical protein
VYKPGTESVIQCSFKFFISKLKNFNSRKEIFKVIFEHLEVQERIKSAEFIEFSENLPNLCFSANGEKYLLAKNESQSDVLATFTTQGICNMVKSVTIDEMFYPTKPELIEWQENFYCLCIKKLKELLVNIGSEYDLQLVESKPSFERHNLIRLLYCKMDMPAPVFVVELFYEEGYKTMNDRFLHYMAHGLYMSVNLDAYQPRSKLVRHRENINIQCRGQKIRLSEILLKTGIFENGYNTNTKIKFISVLPFKAAERSILPYSSSDDYFEIISDAELDYELNLLSGRDHRSDSESESEANEIKTPRSETTIDSDYESFPAAQSAKGHRKNSIVGLEKCKIFINVANESNLITPPRTRKREASGSLSSDPLSERIFLIKFSIWS